MKIWEWSTKITFKIFLSHISFLVISVMGVTSFLGEFFHIGWIRDKIPYFKDVNWTLTKSSPRQSFTLWIGGKLVFIFFFKYGARLTKVKFIFLNLHTYCIHYSCCTVYSIRLQLKRNAGHRRCEELFWKFYDQSRILHYLKKVFFHKTDLITTLCQK